MNILTAVGIYLLCFIISYIINSISSRYNKAFKIQSIIISVLRMVISYTTIIIYTDLNTSSMFLKILCVCDIIILLLVSQTNAAYIKYYNNKLIGAISIEKMQWYNENIRSFRKKKTIGLFSTLGSIIFSIIFFSISYYEIDISNIIKWQSETNNTENIKDSEKSEIFTIEGKLVECSFGEDMYIIIKPLKEKENFYLTDTIGFCEQKNINKKTGKVFTFTYKNISFYHEGGGVNVTSHDLIDYKQK